jgi:hypothetical protein
LGCWQSWNNIIAPGTTYGRLGWLLDRRLGILFTHSIGIMNDQAKSAITQRRKRQRQR